MRYVKTASIIAMVMSLCFVAPLYAGDADNAAYWVDAATGAPLDQLDVAAGQETEIRLVAEVPAGKTLKAYSIMVMYDAENLEVVEAAAAPESAMAPKNINAKTAGEVSINGFSLSGVDGKDDGVAVALLDLAVKGLTQGETFLSVMVTNFGASAYNEFKPEIAPLKVVAN